MNKYFEIQTIKNLIVLLIICASIPSYSQIKIIGTVYDKSTVFPVPYVSVLSNSNMKTITDSSGKYEVVLSEADSIWFSYLGKATSKYSVKDVSYFQRFDVAILIDVPILAEVKVWSGSYRIDSIKNREEFAAAFNYKKPSISSVLTSISLTGFSIDIDELIRTFQYRKKHYALDFQTRLRQQENEKYIDHRFSKWLVTKITGLTGNERDSFIVQNRPTFEFSKTASDYEFNLYIQDCFKKYHENLLTSKND